MSKYFEKELEKGGALTCPCACNAKMNKQTMARLESLRDLYGKPIYIEAGATCMTYSTNLGRSSKSQHIDSGDGARAIDVKSKTFESKMDWFIFNGLAIQLGFTAFGIGSKWVGAGADERTHLDDRVIGEDEDIKTWVYGA